MQPLTRSGETPAVVKKKVLLRLLARREAERIGMVVSPDELEAFVAEWRALFGVDDLESFLRDEGLSRPSFQEIMADFVLINRLEALHDEAIAQRFEDHVSVTMARVRQA